MEGYIGERYGEVHIRVNKAFQILFFIIYLFPVVGTISICFVNPEQFSIFSILVMLLQILFIRLLFVGIAFYFLSRQSESRFRDVLDIEWVK